MFFMAITIMLLLFLIVVSIGVFLSKPKAVISTMVFNKPKVYIDMKVFESEQFKNLKSFPEMNNQYSYTATTKNNKPEVGFISAESIDQARDMLQARGLAVSDIKEVEIGRENPFTPYYQVIVPAKEQKTIKK